MPNGYKISPEDLAKAQKDTLNVHDNSKANINSMMSQLGNLEGVWAGQAAAAFHQLIERFQNASNNLLTDLNQISENLGTAAKQYGHREEETSSAFKSQGGYSF